MNNYKLSLAEIDKRIAAGKYPLRRCLTLHNCCRCNRTIRLGERYYDGGYDRRVHETCGTPTRATE